MEAASGIAERRVLRLRGSGDMSDAPIVDTRPATLQPWGPFEDERACAAGEEALAAAKEDKELKMKEADAAE